MSVCQAAEYVIVDHCVQRVIIVEVNAIYDLIKAYCEQELVQKK